ncbi:putative holin-like toxin [Lactobacillus sp. ESL0700]|nr:putative holin-like toxin [Lactobacillus sp. ESL0700]WEV51075.1 putative holin-like toxin [Lactobacillus sp. ESL0700]
MSVYDAISLMLQFGLVLLALLSYINSNNHDK